MWLSSNEVGWMKKTKTLIKSLVKEIVLFDYFFFSNVPLNQASSVKLQKPINVMERIKLEKNMKKPYPICCQTGTEGQ